MKTLNQLTFSSMFVIVLLTLTIRAQSQISPNTTNTIVKIEDFNNGFAGRNLLNKDTGCFEAPKETRVNDIEQNYKYLDDDNFALRLDYNVTGSDGGSVGYWTRLAKLDQSVSIDSLKLVFDIKGDEEKGYTTMLKIDMKADKGNEVSSVRVGGINAEWQKKEIPLTKFSEISDWENLYELVFVLSATDFTPDDSLNGVLYLVSCHACNVVI